MATGKTVVKVNEALHSIEKQDLVLPEFQREYVWSREQAKQLMVSLVRGYPVGGLLIWKTDTPPELKNIDKLPEKLGTIMVLLDGQQRLTTLHMLVTGGIPAYYKESEILNDPRDLYFNLITRDFQYYAPSRMNDDPRWQRVVTCFANSAEVQPIEIAQQIADTEEQMKTAQAIMDSLSRLQAIKDMDIPEQIVPWSADLDEAIDIFDRVNSQGTKLNEAELALTHITAKWPEARRVLKRKIDDCADKNFHFDLNFMTRALTTVVTGRALFETVHDRPRDQLKAGWKSLEKIIDYLMTILPAQARIHSTDDLNTNNALIPLVAYLAANNGKFDSEQNIHHATNWLYAALMWARYTAQTDQRLEGDVSTVVKDARPWDALRHQIIDQRGRIEVQPADFAGRTAQSPFYRMTFILAKAHDAVDWFNGLPLSQTHGPAYGIHSHHIFPQSRLYKNGYDPNNHTHRQLVNEIANRAFLTADSNVSLSGTLPEEYLPQIEEKFPGALARQFVPMDPALWRIDRFEDFLEARRELIARKMNEFMAALIEKPEIPHRHPIDDVVGLGESAVLEFKSTFQWDVVQGGKNKNLIKSSLKTLAAFMNTQGGTLVIGVEDDGTVYGLEKDLQLADGSQDRFQQLVSEHLLNTIGAAYAPYCDFRFDRLEGKPIFVVDVDRATEPAFMKTDKGTEFFVRVGSTTRSLGPEEAHRYIELNWD